MTTPLSVVAAEPKGTCGYCIRWEQFRKPLGRIELFLITIGFAFLGLIGTGIYLSFTDPSFHEKGFIALWFLRSILIGLAVLLFCLVAWGVTELFQRNIFGQNLTLLLDDEDHPHYHVREEVTPISCHMQSHNGEHDRIVKFTKYRIRVLLRFGRRQKSEVLNSLIWKIERLSNRQISVADTELDACQIRILETITSKDEGKKTTKTVEFREQGVRALLQLVNNYKGIFEGPYSLLPSPNSTKQSQQAM